MGHSGSVRGTGVSGPKFDILAHYNNESCFVHGIELNLVIQLNAKVDQTKE